MLCCIAQRLVSGVRSNDSVVRLGGDEFVVLLMSAHSLDAAEAVAHKLLTALQQPVAYQGRLLQVSASIGVTQVLADSDSPEALLRRADGAMYEAKRNGKARVQRF